MKLERKNVTLAAVAIIGFLVFWSFNFAGSGDETNASRHALDRRGAEEAAVQYVRERTGNAGELKPFAMYTVDRDAFGYFYKEGAIDDVVEGTRDALPLESYRVEVKDPDTGFTHFVDINPYTGAVSEWDLRLSGDPLDEEGLEELGAATLERLGLSAYGPEQVMADATNGELLYTIDNSRFLEATADIRMYADASGVQSFALEWAVPADYAALIERQNTSAGLFGTIGLLLSGTLQFAALIYALSQLRSVRWSRGVVMALVFGVFYCAINVNMYPGLKATLLGILDGAAVPISYDPSGVDGGGAVLAGLIGALIVTNAFTLALAIGLYFSAVAGDTLSARQGWRVWPATSEPAYKRHVATSVWQGYLFAPIMLGLQSIIYIGAEAGFKTWYTIDALTSTNNMLFPLLLPLLAWCAAVSEEVVYRLFAIPALKKLLRFTFPAVLVSSVVWSLGHVQYPTYPFYTRAVEVTLIGLLFGYIFLKHGFLTAVFTHAVVDLIWMVVAIVQPAPTAINWAVAVFYLATPALVGLFIGWFYRRRRTPALVT
ncbi:CPBP family intramembrane metalloprotease [Paenibacillus sp. TRM 82003]|nr:CPBP family intramembrane metalloprotease [Paenibacillus sp. TRM 82003]